MTIHVRPADIGGERDPRSRNDEMVRRASDPAASAWVSANAGAGKTYLLTRRVVRLLLDGVPPARVLCLTYTRAAAAEMLGRVHDLLAAWARMGEPDLCAALAAVTGRDVSRTDCERARALFAHALDTPGGLKIQTIHAFCEAVLHRFPLEANVSGRFRMVDEAERGAMLRAMIADLVAESGSAAGDGALDAVLGMAQAHGLEALFGALDGARLDLDAARAAHGDAAALRGALAARLGLEAGATHATVLADAWPVPGLDAGRLGELTGAARHHGGATNGKHADLVDGLHDAEPAARLDLLVILTHNSKGEPRASYDKKGKPVLSGGFTAKVLADLPWLHAAMADAHVHVGGVRDRLSALALLEASGHALSLGERLHRRWAAHKHARGLMDFDDLIARTADLLDRNGGASWVHYKLDRGIDHVLVDEAQDTSPLQWRVIGRLTGEFHAGRGAAERPRTVFAVGDPKQSIYSFQGARPEGFVDRGKALGRLHAKAGADAPPFHPTTLRLSFRSTRDVLGAVDAVFDAPGTSLGGLEVPEPHEATRRERGFVEAWDFVRAVRGEDRAGEDWTDALDHVAEDDPRMVLARRVAARVRAWIDGAEPLETREGPRPVRPGDVMVLVRRRDAFTGALTRALKDLGVRVAGEDRLALTAHVAVEDLMAVGAAALNPHDDLAVAALFKSPLLGLSEDDLFELAHHRGEDESLYRALRRRGPERPEWLAASEALGAWRDRADREPPFEFYARLLGPDGGRRRILARLGAEAGDVLDELLARALAERPDLAPGLEAFLAALREEAPIVKREMDGRADEVRVMTVHAAKGLEAAAVFLIDPGSEPAPAAHVPALLPLRVQTPEGHEEAPPLVWTAPRLARPEAVEAARRAAREAAADEYRRLLYVGMTRARDRLIVCGSASVRGGGEDTWLATVRRALHATGHCAPCEEAADGASEAGGEGDVRDGVLRYRRGGFGTDGTDAADEGAVPRSDAKKTGSTVTDGRPGGALGRGGTGGGHGANAGSGGRGVAASRGGLGDVVRGANGGGAPADPASHGAMDVDARRGPHDAGGGEAHPATSPRSGAASDQPPRLPRWATPVRAEREPPRPLAPAGTTALIEGEAGGRAGPLLGGTRPADIAALARGEGGSGSGARPGDPLALRRGTLVHRLLQVLPEWPTETREAAARRYVARAAADLPPDWREGLIETALGTLADPAIAELMGEGRAEMAVMGVVEVAGAPRPVSGVIDRIALVPGRAVLVDYKTGARVPRSPAGVPPVHVAQMALYRALAAPLLAPRRVECALVYTEGPARIDLEPWRLDAALTRVVRGEEPEGEAG